MLLRKQRKWFRCILDVDAIREINIFFFTLANFYTSRLTLTFFFLSSCFLFSSVYQQKREKKRWRWSSKSSETHTLESQAGVDSPFQFLKEPSEKIYVGRVHKLLRRHFTTFFFALSSVLVVSHPADTLFFEIRYSQVARSKL